MFDELRAALVARGTSPVVADRIVPAAEVGAWPAAALDVLVKEGLLNETTPSTTVVCDQCWEDHAEPVQFVAEPPGSRLRAYIACPEAGRVLVDTERMRQWEIRAQQSKLPLTTDPLVDGVEKRTEADSDGPETGWPPTAAAFVGILRQARSAGTPGLRWQQIRGRLGSLRLYPHRARDVKRGVANWDEVVDSPHKGFYRLKP